MKDYATFNEHTTTVQSDKTGTIWIICNGVKKLRNICIRNKDSIIETDASPLIGMLNKPDLPSDTASRWTAYLKLFDFELKHLPGKNNVVADSISRTELEEPIPITIDMEDDETIWINNVVAAAIDDETFGFTQVNQASKTTIPINHKYFHIFHYLQNASYHKSATEKDKKLTKALLPRFLTAGDLLFMRVASGMPKRVIIDRDQQQKIAASTHKGHPYAHRGVKTTYRLCSERFYWDNMYRDCEQVVKTCDVCQRRRTHKKEVEPLKPHTGSYLFKRIGIDLVGFHEAATGEKYIVVARDDFSGWVEAKALFNKTSKEVYLFLYENIICRYGIPIELIADRGELFYRRVLEAAQEDGIQTKFTSAYHPQTNGLVERGHKELIEGLAKTAINDINNWPKYLNSVLWADRITTKRTTGESPYKLVYGQNCVLPLDIESSTWMTLPWKPNIKTSELLSLRSRQLMFSSWMREQAGIRQDESRLYNKRYYDRTKILRGKPLEKGDMVLLLNSQVLGRKIDKLLPRWNGPYLINEIPKAGVYRLSELDGTIINSTISGHRIRQYFCACRTVYSPKHH